MIDDLNYFITSSDVKYSKVGQFFLDVFFFDIVSQNEYLRKGIELGKRLIERKEKENRDLEKRNQDILLEMQRIKTTCELQKCDYKGTIQVLELRLQQKEKDYLREHYENLALIREVANSVSLEETPSYIKKQWWKYQRKQLLHCLKRDNSMDNDLDGIRQYKLNILEKWVNTYGSQLSEKEIQKVKDRAQKVIEVIIKEEKI